MNTLVKFKMIFMLTLLVACSQGDIKKESISETKVVTEEDLIREAEEIINAEDDNYWDFSDPKYEEKSDN